MNDVDVDDSVPSEVVLEVTPAASSENVVTDATPPVCIFMYF